MMLLTSTLPLLPPPSSSLLPPLTAPAADPSLSTQPHAHNHSQSSSRRQKNNNPNHSSRNNTLLALTSDERTISQRKMAIAMYGYSWLKPAGCPKTMLGRREEEVEREEVERQLREVELQERMNLEAEEQERIARMRETGEVEEGRDLDEDIPDADDGEEEHGYESDEGDVAEEGVGEGEEDDGLVVDLDDEIPEADELDTEDEDDEPPSPAGADGGWVYDTRREPDTDDEEQLPDLPQFRARGHGRHATVAGVHVPMPGSDYDQDERGAQDLADAMLDEDEMSDDVHQSSARRSGRDDRDLDDDVPDADDEDQAWEHTDTELEESEMDISILPSQPQHSRSNGAGGGFHPVQGQQPRRSSARTTATIRSSGPWITGPSPSPVNAPRSSQIQQPQTQRSPPQGNILPRQRGVPPVVTPTPGLASSSGLRSISTRAARIVSGNRQRPYRPDRVHRPTTRLHQTHTPPAEMVDTPPLAAVRADLGGDIDADVGEDEEIATDELDTNIDGDREDEINVDTPDPFLAPEYARAIAPPDALPRVGRAGQGRGGGGAATGAITDAALGLGIGVARGEDGRTRRRGEPSPARTTAARNWLDGAAASLGVGGNRDASQNGSGPGARRTLFRRATRRNQNPDLDAEDSGQVASATGENGTGTSSGGLFSSPNPGATTTTEQAADEWDTPDAGLDPEAARAGGRRRSGRFLGGRRRGLE